MKGKKMEEKILIIDDEHGLLEVVEAYLKKEDYEVFTADNGKEGLSLYKNIDPNFIILDLMLPDLSGEKICEKIREESDVPILMLTAKSLEDDKINGLALGADDYLTKPFSPRELVMRVKAILRRTNKKTKINNDNIISFNNNDIIIDKEEHIVKKAGEILNITPNEYEILLLFVKNPNKVFTRSQIIDVALGYEFVGYDRTIDAHIKNLRKKLEDNIKKPEYLLTVYGVGYKFKGKKD
ncbi:response regulator transcription factor [Vallitalea sp.]|jgi:DNA-binding response OmpR family regulator|uniref:response regulator transcription factor n=1 Tax=Vallitalea sp. TaxID=1882829 RepID=UPI0025F4AC14|nr:response regulator transcription factor [Vallitalea sp.]MCT4688167.1 response regulator transcription factor [Vallitalea sp.]